jgi:hypothetical protein
MADLLDRIFDAHGGLDRWRDTTQVRFTGSLSGLLPLPRPDFLAQTGAVVDTRTERVVIEPFGAPDHRGLFTPGHVEVQDTGGRVLAERDEPRRAFDGHRPGTLWDEPQAAYFIGYSFWTYLNVPFVLARDDVRVEETEPWREHGETWRRLRVEFPDHIATHNAVQTLYFGHDDHLLRRHDYSPDVLGNPLDAHYTTEYRTYDGFAFPTRRFVMRREPDNTPSGARRIFLNLHAVSVS